MQQGQKDKKVPFLKPLSVGLDHMAEMEVSVEVQSQFLVKFNPISN